MAGLSNAVRSAAPKRISRHYSDDLAGELRHPGLYTCAVRCATHLSHSIAALPCVCLRCRHRVAAAGQGPPPASQCSRVPVPARGGQPHAHGARGRGVRVGGCVHGLGTAPLFFERCVWGVYAGTACSCVEAMSLARLPASGLQLALSLQATSPSARRSSPPSRCPTVLVSQECMEGLREGMVPSTCPVSVTMRIR